MFKKFFFEFCEFFLNYFILKIPSHYIRLFFLKRIYSIGSNVSLLRNIKFYGFNISIGSNTIINSNALLDGRGKNLIIGKNVDIGQDVQIWTLTHDYNDSNNKLLFKKTIIGDYAWICTRAIILPGVKIGKGSVIGAGSVVRRDIDDYSIVVGNPAKTIGKRKIKFLNRKTYRPFFK